MQVYEWAIEDIIDAYPNLSIDDHAAMAVVLMKEHGDSCDFRVTIEGFDIEDLDREFVLRVTWNNQTEQRALRIEETEQRIPIVERGSIALAMLLFSHLIPASRIRVTRRGDRADYWMHSLQSALEVSGTERAAELQRRCRQKRTQVLSNVRGWDGYVVVCCFARGAGRYNGVIIGNRSSYMARSKNGHKSKYLEEMLDEASWLITHADSLERYHRGDEARAEWLRAARCEVDVACLLENDGKILEASIHRFSAASCFAKAECYADAVTLANSAMSGSLKESFRKEIEGCIKHWIGKATKQIRPPIKKQPTPVS